MSRLWFAATTLFGMVALSAFLTQPLAQQAPARHETTGAGEDAPAAAEIRALRADVVAVRLTLGVDDAGPQAWDGTVTIDQGEIVALEGARFRAGDALTGPDSWKARSTATPKAAAKLKAAGEGKARRAQSSRQEGAPVKRGGGSWGHGFQPGTSGHSDGADRPGEGSGDRHPDHRHRTGQGDDRNGRARHPWRSAPPRWADRGAAGARARHRDRDPRPGGLPRGGLRRPGRGLGRLRRARAAGPGGLAQPCRGTGELQELCPQRGWRPGEAGPLQWHDGRPCAGRHRRRSRRLAARRGARGARWGRRRLVGIPAAATGTSTPAASIPPAGPGRARPSG